MGALSYAVAVSITHRQEIFNKQIPHWFSSLSQWDFSQIWLSGLRSSIVAYLCQCHRDQFSVDWLCEIGVPVWYPWGCQETWASQTNAHLARFAPLPHQLQESSTFLQYFTLPHSFRAEPSGSERFRVFPSVSDHISTKFRAFPSGS